MKEKAKTVYYRFVEQMLNALQIAHVRRFPQKHDSKKYGVYVHARLFALRQLEDKSYCFIVEMVAEMPRILHLLDIGQSPHWTTLQKAAQRLRGSLIESLVASFAEQKASASAQALTQQACSQHV